MSKHINKNEHVGEPVNKCLKSEQARALLARVKSTGEGAGEWRRA